MWLLLFEIPCSANLLADCLAREGGTKLEDFIGDFMPHLRVAPPSPLSLSLSLSLSLPVLLYFFFLIDFYFIFSICCVRVHFLAAFSLILYVSFVKDSLSFLHMFFIYM